ncbi:MAG: hypothetical protein IPI83_14695 [Sphingomonadales bacterium]|nr:hypothetical protein [Sphingomonadales bacterium]
MQPNFEVIVSQNRPADGTSWLPITPDCVGLLIRTHYHSGTEFSAQIGIERIGRAAPADPTR